MKRADIAAYLLDFCYPNVCDCCGGYLSPRETVCKDCLTALGDLRTDYACWQQYHRSFGEDLSFPWADLVTVYAYEACARKGILEMKAGARNFGAHLAEELASLIQSAWPVEEIDFVTWVPVSDTRRRIQGYGHSEYLAKQLAKRLSLKTEGGYIKEQHSHERQHQQTAAERIDFVQRFSASKKTCEGACVLLCDDILTTGSTMRRCTELLLQAGAVRVYAAAGLCTANHRNQSKQP